MRASRVPTRTGGVKIARVNAYCGGRPAAAAEGYELSRDGKALPDDDARVPGMGDQGEQLALALDYPQHTG